MVRFIGPVGRPCSMTASPASRTGWPQETPAGPLPELFRPAGSSIRWAPTTSRDNVTGQLLESCYRRSLEVADELEVRTIAFPLISAGIYGWPRQDAVIAAIDTIRSVESSVEEARLVAFDRTAYEEIRAALARP